MSPDRGTPAAGTPPPCEGAGSHQRVRWPPAATKRVQAVETSKIGNAAMDRHRLPGHQPSAPPLCLRTGTQEVPQSWSIPLALAWSAATVVWALAWATDWLPHPFGSRESVMVGAVFNAAPPMVGIAFTLVLGVAGIVTATAMRRIRRHGASGGPTVEALGWLLALTMVATLLHGKVLPPLGYAPVVLVLGWFDPTLFTGFLDALRDPELHLQFHALAGVALWLRASVIHRRGRLGSCPICGRPHGWTDRHETATREAALRRGRAAVAVAAAAALIYPALRLPWLIGMPIGMDAESFALVEATPSAVQVGVAMGFAALVGVGLMFGLVRDWGVRLPRWLPGLSGCRVPVRLAVIPATIVALALVAMGRGFLTALVFGQLAGFATTDRAHILAFVAMLPWGLALGVATAAYAQRRRGSCQRCLQGRPEELPSMLAAVPRVDESW
jgi:hypothetical protein